MQTLKLQCLYTHITQMDNTVIVSNYLQMDRVNKENRRHVLNLAKTIKATGCNVLLIQKSILRDAVDDTSLWFLAKLGILAVKDVERDEMEFLSRSLGCKPISDIDAFTADKLGYADLVEEESFMGTKVTKIQGIKGMGRTVSILATGANSMIVDETERSLHDALCVVRCLVKKRHVQKSACLFLLLLNITSYRALIGGGGSAEIHASRMLSAHAVTLKGMEAYCFQAFADALEVIPTTLAENAGLNPIAIVTELRNRHALGETHAGINIRRVRIVSSLLLLFPLLPFPCLAWAQVLTMSSVYRVSYLTSWKKKWSNHCWSRRVLLSWLRRLSVSS